eukprot:GSA25T00010436001.1
MSSSTTTSRETVAGGATREAKAPEYLSELTELKKDVEELDNAAKSLHETSTAVVMLRDIQNKRRIGVRTPINKCSPRSASASLDDEDESNRAGKTNNEVVENQLQDK